MNGTVAIVPAAGSGSRMQSAIPKNFLLLNEKPLFLHTLYRLASCVHINRIIIAIRPEDEHKIIDFCAPLSNMIDLQYVYGGPSRQHSVASALSQVTTQKVLIHDAARPFISQEVLNRLFLAAKDKPAVTLAVPMVDTLKEVDHQGWVKRTLPRNCFCSVQTPQIFDTTLLKKAHQTAIINHDCTYTDDASLLEAIGISVYTVLGDTRNFKLTSPHDFWLAQLMIDKSL